VGIDRSITFGGGRDWMRWTGGAKTRASNAQIVFMAPVKGKRASGSADIAGHHES